MSEKNEWKLVPVDRSYDMRVKALIAFNTAEQSGKDRDDALDAAFQAMLGAAPCPTCNDRGAVGNILNAEPCPDCSPTSVAPGDAQKVYHFEQRSRFGPWIEVEKPTAKSVEFIKRSAAPAAGDALPNFDIEAAAQKMAECMDYPWAHMPEQGRTHMRKYAQAVIDAALAAQVPHKDKGVA